MPGFKLKLSFLVLVCGATFLKAQEESKILRLSGGRIESSLKISNNLFYGIGGQAAHLGSISSFGHSPGAVYWNPSLLAGQKASLSFDFTPELKASLGNLIDLEEKIRTSTDAAIKDFRAEESEIFYTRLSTIAQQSDRITSLLLTFPFKKTVFAFYYHKEINLDISAIFSGLSTRINTKLALGEAKDDIFFNSFMAGHFSLQFGLDKAAIAAGRRLLPQLYIGGALQRYGAFVSSAGIMNVEGTMLFGGKENTFNDPNDNWHNDLNQALRTQYRGRATGVQLAASYQPADNLQFNLVYDWAPDVVMNGFMDLLNNTVPALNLDVLTGEGDPQQEILDASRLKLSQLTFTQKVDNKTYPKLRLRLPKSLKIGMAYQWKGMALHLLYSRSFSPASFRYGEDELGLQPGSTFRLGFDFKYIQLGLGAAALSKKVPDSRYFSSDRQSFQVPLFSLGTSFNFGGKYSIHLLAISLPTPILRTGFSVRLE